MCYAPLDTSTKDFFLVLKAVVIKQEKSGRWPLDEGANKLIEKLSLGLRGC